MLAAELVDEAREALRYVAVSEVFSHDRAVLRLRLGVIVGLARARLGLLLDEHLVQQRGDALVDVLRAIVTVKAADDERKTAQQLLEHRDQVRLAEALTRTHRLELRDAIHRIDVIDALQAVPIPLMHAVDAQESGSVVRSRRAPAPDRHRERAGFAPQLAMTRIADTVA